MREAKQLARKLELQQVGPQIATLLSPRASLAPTPPSHPAHDSHNAPHSPLTKQLRSEAGDSGGSVIIMQLKEDKEQADGEKAMLAERSRLLQVSNRVA